MSMPSFFFITSSPKASIAFDVFVLEQEIRKNKKKTIVNFIYPSSVC